MKIDQLRLGQVHFNTKGAVQEMDRMLLGLAWLNKPSERAELLGFLRGIPFLSQEDVDQVVALIMEMVERKMEATANYLMNAHGINVFLEEEQSE